MRSFIAVISISFFLSSALGATDSLLRSTTLASVPFGNREGAITPRLYDDAGDGLPTSFIKRTGYVVLLVPHMRSLLVYDLQGNYIKTVELTRSDGGPLDRRRFLRDMNLDEKGNYLILDSTLGTMLRFDAGGRQIDEFGLFIEPDSFELDELGRVHVHNEGWKHGRASILSFEQSGKYLGETKGAYLNAHCHGDHFVRSYILDFKNAFLMSRMRKSQATRLVAVVQRESRLGKLYQCLPIGYDKEGNVLCVTTEKYDERYHSYVLRMTQSGYVLNRDEIGPYLTKARSIARFYRYCRETNELLAFKVTGDAFDLVSFKLSQSGTTSN